MNELRALLRFVFGVGGAKTIRFTLFWLVLVCVLPGTLISAYLIASDYRLGKARMTLDAIITARAMAAVLDKELAGIESGLRVLAISPSLASGDLPGFHARAKNALQFQYANNYVLLDASGAQKMNTLLPLGQPLPKNGGPPQMLRVFETDALVLTDLFVGPVTGAPILAMGVPVHKDGKINYSLSAGILPERIAAVLLSNALPDGWISAILDGNGTLIARSHEMQRFVGKKAVPQLVDAARQRAEGVLETITLEGIPVITVFSRTRSFNWTVAIGVPRAVMESQLKRSLWLLVAATLILVGFALGLATRLAQRITRAIQGLAEPALALGSGAQVHVPPLDLKEADELGNALMLASKLLQRTQRDAHHDSLTGLVNRALFMELLSQQIMMAERGQQELSVLFFDLDGFKSVNDRHGHLVGDQLLQAAAKRFKEGVRAADTVARLGGDEFALMLPQSTMQDAELIAAKLIETLAEPFVLGDIRAQVTASVGIAVYPCTARTATDLLSKADLAMYQAKRSGNGTFATASTLSI